MNMKCKDAEQMILLAESGELAKAELAGLNEHLADCAKCAAYRDSMLKITGLAKEALPAGDPSDSTMLNIRAAAVKAATPHLITMWSPAARVLAYAAVLTIAVGGWFLFKPELSNGLAQRIDSTHAIVSMIVPQELQNGAQKPDNRDNDRQLKALSEKLLRLEGLSEESPSLSSECSFFEPDPEV